MIDGKYISRIEQIAILRTQKIHVPKVEISLLNKQLKNSNEMTEIFSVSLRVNDSSDSLIIIVIKIIE